MVGEALDFNYLLLENYKKLNLSEDEVTTLLMINHLISEGNTFITADLLSLKMSMPIQEIDKVFANLLTRGFIEYKTSNKSTITSLNPLKEKLIKEFRLGLSAEEEQKNIDFRALFAQFEQHMGRSLSNVEQNKIKEWIAFGHSEATILNALKEVLAQGKKSLRSVDKLLLQWAAREDIEKEGQSPLSESWQKNLEETIRIAKTPWLNSDDEENK